MTNAEAFVVELQALVEKYEVSLNIMDCDGSVAVYRDGYCQYSMDEGLKPGDPPIVTKQEPIDGPQMPLGYRYATTSWELELPEDDVAAPWIFAFLSEADGAPCRMYIYDHVVVAFAWSELYGGHWRGITVPRGFAFNSVIEAPKKKVADLQSTEGAE